MQGISVYLRPGRPTYYVAYDCPVRARRVCESTGISINDPRGKLGAYAYAREKSQSGVARGQARDESCWENWAKTWLQMRYAGNPKTLGSYLSYYLAEHKIPTPRALNYRHVVEFAIWRETVIKKRTGKHISRNTSIHNIKVLSRLMREAIRRGFATANPCLGLSDDVPATPAPKKAEFTDSDIAKIRKELARRKAIGVKSDWMEIAFEISLHQACRLSATQIPMECIDLDLDTIQFHEKGGQIFTVPLHPGLKPLLARLKEDGRLITCKLPTITASREFIALLRSIGLPHSFHCLRVTGITRMARAGIPEQQSMAYVHHGSWAIHKIYQRLKPADVRGCHAALVFSPPAAPAPVSPQIQDAHPTTPTPLPVSSIVPKKSKAHYLGQRVAG